MEDDWSHDETKALKQLLKEFPSSLDKNERFKLIASKMSGRNKRQCYEHYKELRAKKTSSSGSKSKSSKAKSTQHSPKRSDAKSANKVKDMVSSAKPEPAIVPAVPARAPKVGLVTADDIDSLLADDTSHAAGRSDNSARPRAPKQDTWSALMSHVSGTEPSRPGRSRDTGRGMSVGGRAGEELVIDDGSDSDEGMRGGHGGTSISRTAPDSPESDRGGAKTPPRAVGGWASIGRPAPAPAPAPKVEQARPATSGGGRSSGGGTWGVAARGGGQARPISCDRPQSAARHVAEVEDLEDFDEEEAVGVSMGTGHAPAGGGTAGVDPLTQLMEGLVEPNGLQRAVLDQLRAPVRPITTEESGLLRQLLFGKPDRPGQYGAVNDTWKKQGLFFCTWEGEPNGYPCGAGQSLWCMKKCARESSQRLAALCLC